MRKPGLEDRLRSALARGTPKCVARVVTRLGTDSTGDQALWIWIIVKDDSSDDRTQLKRAARWAENAANEVSPERWAYIAFRTVTEQLEVENARAKRA